MTARAAGCAGALLLTVAGLGSLCAYGLAHACDPAELARVDAGPGRVIRILEETCWEYQPALFYEVIDHGRVVMPVTYLSAELDHETRDPLTTGSSSTSF
jgi:hypothetical protein